MKSMTQRIINITQMQISIFILSLVGIIAKKASTFDFHSFYFYIYFGLELFAIAIYALLWQQIIKKFDISVAYANKGTLIIWTFIWAVLFFNETITMNNYLGAILVIAGIIMVFKDA